MLSEWRSFQLQRGGLHSPFLRSPYQVADAWFLCVRPPSSSQRQSAIPMCFGGAEAEVER